MQRQNSGQKTPMPLQKFSAARVQANATRPQRAQQVAAVVALADSVLKSASGKRKTTPPRGDIHKLEGFDAHSLGAILRARLAAKGKP